MKKEVITRILVVIVFLLIGGMVYESIILYNKDKSLKECESVKVDENLSIEKENTNNNCDCNDQKIITNSIVSGLYEVKGSNPDTMFELFLDENETFMFLDDTPSVYGRAGNYYINGERIVLNNLFIISDGMSIKTNNDNSQDVLIYNNGVIDYTKENITLTKNTVRLASFKESMGTLFDWLSKGYYTNNNS